MGFEEIFEHSEVIMMEDERKVHYFIDDDWLAEILLNTISVKFM